MTFLGQSPFWTEQMTGHSKQYRAAGPCIPQHPVPAGAGGLYAVESCCHGGQSWYFQGGPGCPSQELAPACSLCALLGPPFGLQAFCPDLHRPASAASCQRSLGRLFCTSASTHGSRALGAGDTDAEEAVFRMPMCISGDSEFEIPLDHSFNPLKESVLNLVCVILIYFFMVSL